MNKSTLVHVTLRGQPKSVYKSNTECRFLESWDKMAKWPWRSSRQGHIPIKSADKPNFLEFWVKMEKMALKVKKANDPYSRYQPRVSHDACLVQI